MIDTCARVAIAASAKTMARLTRSSNANFRSSDTRCARRRTPDLSSHRNTTNPASAAAATARAPSAARPALPRSMTSGSATIDAVSAIAT